MFTCDSVQVWHFHHTVFTQFPAVLMFGKIMIRKLFLYQVRGIFSGRECRLRCFCGFGKSFCFCSWFWFLCSSSILSIFLQIKHRHVIMKTHNVSSARYVIKIVCPNLKLKKRCLDELSKTVPRLCEFMFTPESI